MKSKSLHIIPLFLYLLTVLMITFSTLNPLILLIIFICEISILILLKKSDVIFKIFKFFLPIILITMIINMTFVNAGVVVLFNIFNKIITLENLIYSLLFCLKLLIAIYIFYLFEILIDSDLATSYFSSIMPKSTLMFMVCLKLIPNMKKKVKELKDIYTTRGIDFNEGSRMKRINSQIPILKVLIEESLESSFDIAESAYIRGFLKGKRSVYGKRNMNREDYFVSILSIVLMVLFIVSNSIGVIVYDVYEDYLYKANIYSFIISFLIVLLSVFIYINHKGE